MATATPITEDSDTLTLYDLVQRTGLSYTTIYEQARLNKLPVPVFKIGRRYLVSRKAYEAVLNARHEPTATDVA